jgi:hypothetical protein
MQNWKLTIWIFIHEALKIRIKADLLQDEPRLLTPSKPKIIGFLTQPAMKNDRPSRESAGWQIQDNNNLNLGAGLGVAVREFPLINRLCRLPITRQLRRKEI